MKKVKVSICAGTACFVMGSSELLLLEDHLSAELKNCVEVEGITCLGLCKEPSAGKAPFVKVNEEILSHVTLADLIEKIEDTIKHSEGSIC